MDNPMFQMTVPFYIKYLRNMRNILEKAEEFAKEKKIDESVILGSRLAIDMLPFSRQVQIASDNAKSTAAQLAGVENPKMPDTESSIAELMKRCDDTIIFLETLSPESFSDAGDRKIKLPYFPGKYFLAKDFIPEYGIPNFLFHIVTAYGILRHNGLTIGKADFVGGMTQHDE